jgi:hypothetical protein
LFFDNSNDCIQWRAKTLLKARENLEIGIIKVNKGGRAFGEPNAMAARSAIEVTKRVTYTHTLRFLRMIQIIMLKLGKLYRYSRLYKEVKNPSFHQL